jgi:hypothetical protein
VYESDRSGGESFRIWAGICHDGRTQLKIVQGTLNAVKYRIDILCPIVQGFSAQYFVHIGKTSTKSYNLDSYEHNK